MVQSLQIYRYILKRIKIWRTCGDVAQTMLTNFAGILKKQVRFQPTHYFIFGILVLNSHWTDYNFFNFFFWNHQTFLA